MSVIAADPAPGVAPTASAELRSDIRVAGLLGAGLLVAGALLGVLWSAWSGPQQRAYVIAPGQLYPFDEVETRAAADGRYLVLVGVVGLLAGLGSWLLRRVNRGPAIALALGVGGLFGSLLTAAVGHLTGGGTESGKTGSTIAHLPLSLHMPGLVFAEPALALLVYGLFAAFAVHDDLGRPDEVRDRLVEANSAADSVDAGSQAEHGWRDRDGAGALQQGEFPSQ